MKLSVVRKTLVASFLVVGVAMSTAWAFPSRADTMNQLDDVTAMSGSQDTSHNMLLSSAMNQVHFAQSNLNRMLQQGDQRQIRLAHGVLKDAEFLLVSVMSQASGVPGREITNMHRAGLSWMEIPARLDMNASVGVSGTVVVGKNDNDLHTEIMNQNMEEMHGTGRYSYPPQNGYHMNYEVGNRYSRFNHHGSMH